MFLGDRLLGGGDNQAQHRARGSHGVDHGLHWNLKEWSKVIGSRPSAHGDVVKTT